MRDGPLVTLGTLFEIARQYGWNEAACPPTGAPDGGESEATGRQSQRERLLLVGMEADLWHDADGETFGTFDVNGHRESSPVKSTAFRRKLTAAYGARFPLKVGGASCPSAPSAQALNEAINALDAKAAVGPDFQAAVRVAAHDGAIYLDLGTPEWNAIRITDQEWRVVTSCPIRFVRPPGFRPLPVPIKGGSINELLGLLNLTNADDFILVVGWLVAALMPTGPYAVLIVNGEQGSGKSIFCRVLRRLIDPNKAEIRAEPKDERDLLIAAKNGQLVALDNLSYVRNDLSDAICRVATKGAFATRALYTNDEEYIAEVCRPVLINGIPSLASRADLADRAIVLVLPTMRETLRRSESEYWVDFDAAAPRILGCLLDGLSGALRLRNSIVLKRPPRMIDFAITAEAACRALGFPAGKFEGAYQANRIGANDEAIEADSVARTTIKFISEKGSFVGTATELLHALDGQLGPGLHAQHWPKDATRLSSRLRRAAPLLRQRGIEVVFDEKSHDGGRRRLISLQKFLQK